MIFSNRDRIEKELIASVVLAGKYIAQAISDIADADFFYDINRKMFHLVRERWERDGALSYGLVVQDYIDNNILVEDWYDIVNAEINDPGGCSWFIVLDHLRKLSKQDELRSVVTKMTTAVSVTPEQIADVERLISQSLKPTARTKTNRDLAREFIDFLGGAQQGLKIGIGSVDDFTGGLLPKKLYVIAGRPGQGKTALAHQAAMKIADDGKRVAIVTAEMTANDVLVRLISRDSHIPAKLIQQRKLTDSSMGAVVDSLGRIFQRDTIRIIEAIGRTWPEVAALIHAECVASEFDMVILDQLQSMAFEGRNLVQDIGKATKGFRVLADKHGFAAVLLCQLSRRVERKDGGTPTLGDLRDSGNIEQDADVVLFIHGREQKHTGKKDSQARTLTVAKNRFGATGHIKAIFHGPTTTFEEDYDLE